jgi:hypothetical protein
MVRGARQAARQIDLGMREFRLRDDGGAPFIGSAVSLNRSKFIDCLAGAVQINRFTVGLTQRRALLATCLRCRKPCARPLQVPEALGLNQPLSDPRVQLGLSGGKKSPA